jgi:hypothetical protein
VTYHGNGIYRSIIDGTEVRVKALPRAGEPKLIRRF